MFNYKALPRPTIRRRQAWPDDVAGILAMRQSAEDRGWSYKLAEAGDAYALDMAPTMGFSIPNAVDETRMSVKYPFAASVARDRVGDFLEVSGIRTDSHRFNPVAFLDHAKNFHLPLGKCESPEGVYTVTIDPSTGVAIAECFFSQHLLEAAQIFQLCVEGILGRAGSIGYRTIRAAKLDADPDQGYFKPALHLLEVELLEPSIVTLPVNQTAVRKALSMSTVCGKSLAPSIRRALEPYAGEGKAWARGWSPPVEDDLTDADRQQIHARLTGLTRQADRCLVATELEDDLSEAEASAIVGYLGELHRRLEGLGARTESLLRRLD